MKNKLTLLTIAFFLSIGIYAQAPNLINYQAVARDAAGVPLIGTGVDVLFEIRQSTPNGTVVYSETHTTTTNQFGLFNLAIGGGTPQSGTFAGIIWGSGIYYLHIEVDPGSGYQDLGETQLLSVPYALHANTATSGTPGANGHNSLTNITIEPNGVNCANGGYFVEVGVDDNDDQTLQALEVDLSYYVCNGLDGAANNNDTSATNEIQMLSISNDTIFLSNGGFVVLPSASGDNWGTDVVNTTGGNISGDGTAGNPLSVTDNDTSATNELELPMTGNNVGDVLKWNGSAWVNANDSVDDADNDPANEIELPPTATLNQVLTWNGTAWVAQNPGSGADNWGSQVVITTGGNMSGDGTAGNPLAVSDNDTSATNEIQSLSVSGNTINISGGTGANISAIAPTTGDYLYWNGVNWVSQTPAANTDNQNLINGGKSGNNQTIDIQNGTGVTFSVADADSSTTNEIQTLSFSDPTLTLSNGGGTVSIPDTDPTNEYNTNFTVNAGNLELTDGGNTFQVPLTSLGDNDWTSGTGTIYNTTDSIGIGTNAPEALLHVTRYNTPQFKIGNDNQPAYEWSFEVDPTAHLGLFNEGNGSKWAMLYMDVNNRFLGVGRTAPSTNLHVEGTSAIARLQSTTTTTAANSYIEFGNTNTGTFNRHGYVGNPGTGDHMQYEATTFHRFTTQGTERMRLTNAGDLAIGNFTAFSQLDVAGQITMRTGAVNGYIPVSDANGTMTWTDPSTITTASLWSASAGSIYPTTLTDFVGIGTATPAVPLDVYTNTSGRAGQFIQDFSSSSTKYGIYSLAQGAGTGTNYGLSGEATGGGTNIGVRGRGFGGAGNYSGYFDLGDFYIADNLGIGTTTPAEKLHVVHNNSIIAKFEGTTASGAVVDIDGGPTGAQSGVRFITQGASRGGIMYDDATSSINTFVFGAPAGEGIYLNTGTYNVGIGMNNPSYKLDVTGSTHISGNLLVGSIPSIQAKAQINGTGYSWAFKILGGGSNTQVLGVETGTGNTVIGNTTSSPGAQLEIVNSTASVNATTDGILNVGQNNTTHLTMDGNEIQARSSTGTSTLYLNYWGADVDIARSSGSEVGIGVLPSSSYKLYVSTSTNARAATFLNSYSSTGFIYGVRGEGNNPNASGEGIGVYGRGQGGASGTAYGLYGYATGAGTNWAVYASGNAYSTGTWQTSDARFKTDVKEVNNAVDKVMQLKASTYNFDTEKYSFMNLPKGKQYGFLAQELEQVIPEAVMDVTHNIGIDDPEKEGETFDFKAVNYNYLIPLLTKAIQEQQEMIEQLKLEIQDLKNQ